jgi:acetoin utilization deacetylase AcuC-like enzyme
MEIGAVDADYQLVFAKVVSPILLQFEPDLVIVSAGFDAHERDPLGGMRLTTPAFAAMTRELRAVADECCRGRIVSVTEGGYDLQALAASLDAVIDQHAAPAASASWPSGSVVSSRGETTVAQLRPILAPFWTI